VSAAPGEGDAPAKPAPAGVESSKPATGPVPGPAVAPRPPAPERLHLRLALAPIRLYQRVISPALPRRCKYHPTCSAYAVEAIRSYGILRGSVLAAWRLLRCNPFSHGGYDPVSAQTLFRRPPRSHSASASHS
jgi:putative membrane protein insertion efficiency factor